MSLGLDVAERKITKRPIKREGMLEAVDPSFNFTDEDNQYWKCKYGSVVFTIVPSTLVQDAVSGRIMPKPGLSIPFKKGRWSIEKNHPDRKMIETRLRQSDTYKAGVLVCLDDIPPNKRHLINPEQIGDGPRQRLHALGVTSDEQRVAIVELLTDIDEGEKIELKSTVDEHQGKIDEQNQLIKALENRLKEMNSKGK